jgi:glycosyltransferase involved in cell wall biosynthesis
MPRVSVITPFVNEASFLAAAIDSVKSQSFPDWELLLVDDGSNDESAAIAGAYAQSLPDRIHILQPDPGHRGAAAARNRGIAAASGKYIAFLDADDVYEPWKLQHEVAILDRYPEAAMLYGPSRWWYPGSWRPGRTERTGVPSDRIYQPPELLTEIIVRRRGDIPCTCGVLIRSEIVKSLGAFEERFRLYEDQTLWVKVFLSYPVYISSRQCARYRQHAGSTSARAQSSGEYQRFGTHSAHLQFLCWLKDYVGNKGVRDASLESSIARQLAFYETAPSGTIARLMRRIAWFRG